MTTDSPLRTRLRSALLEARRAGDRTTTSTVRTVLAALENAEAVPIDSMSSAGAIEEAVVGVGETDVPRRTLSAADEQSVLEQEIRALRESVAAYDDVAPDRAAAARAGIELLTTLR